MNLKMVLYTTARIMQTEALFMLLPLAVSFIYGEYDSAQSFIITILTAFLLGVIISRGARTKNRVIYAKEGFAIVALAWLMMSFFGALPFVISRDIPSYVDAFFETVSGFTTTGASILDDVEAVSKGMLFWRSFTHWIGGMGVLVFVMAVIPNISDRSIHIMRAEMPGPVIGKLMPRAKDTAKILYLIYIVLTAAEILFLLAGGMSLFDSLIHSFGTAGTGGFGIKADSVSSYSPYIQWVITIFMIIFGVNFNLFYLILIHRAKTAFKSSEFWWYIGIALSATAVIAFNIRGMYSNFSDTVRHSAFQVASILTTTGFATANFDTWPELSKTVLLLLMFIGGCAGSTAGGLKVSRVVLLFRTVKREIKHLLHPRSVSAVHFEGKPADIKTVMSVCVYFVFYMLCFFAILLLLGFEPFSFETNFSAAASCFNNVGPGFDGVGPMVSYSGYSPFSKIVLSAAMLLGRLEIYPLILAFVPSTWNKR